MKISKILIPTLAVIIAASFIACSSSSSSDDKNVAKIVIPIDVNCTATSSTADIETYITTQAGDSIVQDETNTTVSLFIDATDTKKVCLVSGKAHILR